MIQLDALKKRPERHTRRQTDKQTNRQKLTCRSSANFVSAGQKQLFDFRYLLGMLQESEQVIIVWGGEGKVRAIHI